MALRFVHCCDACPAEVRSDSRNLPKGWARRRRAVEGVAGVPFLDYCRACALDAGTLYKRQTRTRVTNRRAVRCALEARPGDNDAELALYISEAGNPISAETVRRHRTALGVPPRRRHKRHGVAERG